MKEYKKLGLIERVFQIFSVALMLILVIMCTYPFYYILIISVSDASKSLGDVFVAPVGFSLDAYSTLLAQKDIFTALVISISRTVLGTIITLFCCSFFAFILTKKFTFKKVIYRMLIVTMYFNAGLIPWYITMKTYMLKDNFLLYIIPSAISAFFVILIKTFIEQLPPALEEAALIDGAGLFKVFYKIILPLSKPILATIAVFSAVNQWNTWMDNYFLVHDNKLQTLQLILYNILNEAESYARKMQDSSGGTSVTQVHINAVTIRMAITMLTSLPIIFVYPFMQKYFIKGIMMGAIKG